MSLLLTDLFTTNVGHTIIDKWPVTRAVAGDAITVTRGSMDYCREFDVTPHSGITHGTEYIHITVTEATAVLKMDVDEYHIVTVLMTHYAMFALLLLWLTKITTRHQLFTPL